MSVLLDKDPGADRTAAVTGLRAAAGNFPGRRRRIVEVLARTFKEGSGASEAAALALSELDAPRATADALRAAARMERTSPRWDPSTTLPAVRPLRAGAGIA